MTTHVNVLPPSFIDWADFAQYLLDKRGEIVSHQSNERALIGIAGTDERYEIEHSFVADQLIAEPEPAEWEFLEKQYTGEEFMAILYDKGFTNTQVVASQKLAQAEAVYDLRTFRLFVSPVAFDLLNEKGMDEMIAYNLTVRISVNRQIIPNN